MHPGSELLLRLLQFSALVIAPRTGEDVGPEVPPADPRGVPIDAPSVRRRKLPPDPGVAGQDTGEVHHLSEAQHPLPAKGLRHLQGPKLRSRGLQG